MSLATLVGFVMIAWDLMAVRQAELTPAIAKVPVKDDEAKKIESVEAVTAVEPEKVPVATPPVRQEPKERQKSGGKRRRKR
jgi:hypothetical protein